MRWFKGRESLNLATSKEPLIGTANSTNFENQMDTDPRSCTCERNLCNCEKKPEKYSGLQRGMNPWPRDTGAVLLPNELWSHWHCRQSCPQSLRYPCPAERATDSCPGRIQNRNHKILVPVWLSLREVSEQNGGCWSCQRVPIGLDLVWVIYGKAVFLKSVFWTSFSLSYVL